MKNLLSLLSASLFFIMTASPVYAQSLYILPYPSAMPGSKLYLLQELKDTALQYWYFGNFGQFTYYIKQSDKYLVEAKTLFEYDQYLLAAEALQKSNTSFRKVPLFLTYAKQEKKDVSAQEALLQSAAQKHIEVLLKLKKELPEKFIWKPEKQESSVLPLHDMLDEAILVRKNIL